MANNGCAINRHQALPGLQQQQSSAVNELEADLRRARFDPEREFVNPFAANRNRRDEMNVEQAGGSNICYLG